MSNTTSLALKRLPECIQNGMCQYVHFGTEPGSFLKAALENDLKRTIQLANDETMPFIRDIVNYIHWEIPGPCQGSPGAVCAWVEQGGEAGRE